jgi:SAM-dependent methyltransferase
MIRTLQPELLDELPVEDPRAIDSRRDLRKVNLLMGHDHVIAGALKDVFRQRIPKLIVDLGAGDGSLLLRVARRLAEKGTGAFFRAILVDQQPLVAPDTRAQFETLGWRVESVEADVFEWLRRGNPETADVTIANLFLHHFSDRELTVLLGDAALQTRRFVACEPLRSPIALAGAAMLRVLGCNGVTRHDAKISVRAGFRDHELSALWPREGWQLTEGRAGPFTHFFLAASCSPSC